MKRELEGFQGRRERERNKSSKLNQDRKNRYSKMMKKYCKRKEQRFKN